MGWLDRTAPLALCAIVAGACTGTVSDPGGDVPGVLPPVTSDVASASGARRLTNVELDNTLRDLLGESGSPTSMLPADQYTPYDNDIDTQMASAALITSLEIMARGIAERVVSDPARRDAVVPCTPTGPGDTDCLRQFIVSWAEKAFRRPLTDGEITAYLTLQDFATEDNPDVANDFYTAVALVITAVLQDPEFLYRIERGTPTSDPNVLALSDWEVATRLSFMLWATTPDEDLLADAAAGRLTDPSSRRAVAEGMLEQDLARNQLKRFHALWLGHRILPQPPDLVAAFNRETGALLDRVVFDEPQSYQNVFTFDETWLDDGLADHYGLPRPAGGEGWVPYADSGRGGGILSHGSILAAFAKFADTSPTQRGILIRTRLMCQDIPPPPLDVNADEPPENTEGLCKYEQYEAHRSNGACAACHALMDPIGFGLENFDMAGRYRTHDDGRPECTIEGVGEFPAPGAAEPATFQGPGELGQMLVDGGYIERCVLQQWYSFATGRQVGSVEQPVIDELLERFRAGDHDLRALILDYIESDRFALRREEAQ